MQWFRAESVLESKLLTGIRDRYRMGNRNKNRTRSSDEMSTTLIVEGMSCEHCEQSVEEALEALPGVTAASADREREQATVEGDADTAQLVQAVEDAGYSASA
jgi:copper chaperone